MQTKRAHVTLLVAVLALVSFGCRRLERLGAAPTPVTAVSSEVLRDPEAMLDDERDLGAPMQFGRLTLFPIYATHHEDLGRFTTIDDALGKKEAEVRELGAVGSAAQVNRLVIENKGDVPIYVLAGTVVKGGHQDRQIGQDVVVAPHTTTEVDAFCVEAGRWNGDRDGLATNGKFSTSKGLANVEVRVAGQYEKNQGKVWSKVGKTNDASKKKAPSGTLMATLDAKEVVEARTKLAERVRADLATVARPAEVVGIAYAVGGKVRAVRWFGNHELFALFERTLVDAAALETVVGATDDGASAAVTRKTVKEFVVGVKGADTKEERPTSGENVNAYKESASGYGSETTLKTPAGKTGALDASKSKSTSKSKAKLSADFVSK